MNGGLPLSAARVVVVLDPAFISSSYVTINEL